MVAGGGGMRASQEARWRQNVKDTAARRRRAERLAQEERAKEEYQRKEALERRKADRKMSDKYLRAPAQAPPQPQKPILRKGAGRKNIAKPSPDAVAKPVSPGANARNVQARLRAHIREQREKLVRQKAAQEPIAVDDTGLAWHTARQMAAQGLDHLLQEVMPDSSPASDTSSHAQQPAGSPAAPMRDLSSLLAEMGPPPEAPCPTLLFESAQSHSHSRNPEAVETGTSPDSALESTGQTSHCAQPPQYRQSPEPGRMPAQPLYREYSPEHGPEAVCQPRLSLLLEQMGPPRNPPRANAEANQQCQVPSAPKTELAEDTQTPPASTFQPNQAEATADSSMPAWTHLAGTLDSLESQDASPYHSQALPAWACLAEASPDRSRDQLGPGGTTKAAMPPPPDGCPSPGKNLNPGACAHGEPTAALQKNSHLTQSGKETHADVCLSGQCANPLEDSNSASRNSNRCSLDDSAQSFDFGTPAPAEISDGHAAGAMQSDPARQRDPDSRGCAVPANDRAPPTAARQTEQQPLAATSDRFGSVEQRVPDPGGCAVPAYDHVPPTTARQTKQQPVAATSDRASSAQSTCGPAGLDAKPTLLVATKGTERLLWPGVRPTGDRMLDCAGLEASAPQSRRESQPETSRQCPAPFVSSASVQEGLPRPAPLTWEIPTSSNASSPAERCAGISSAVPEPAIQPKARRPQQHRKEPVQSAGNIAGKDQAVAEWIGPARPQPKGSSQVLKDPDAGVEGQRQCKGSYAEAMATAKHRAEKERVERERLAAELAKRRAEVAARDARAKATAEKNQAAAKKVQALAVARPVYAAPQPYAPPAGQYPPQMVMAPPMPAGGLYFAPPFMPMVPQMPQSQGYYGGVANPQPVPVHIQTPAVAHGHPRQQPVSAANVGPTRKEARVLRREQPASEDLQAVHRLNMSIELSDDEADGDAPDLPDDWEEQLSQPRPAPGSHQRSGPSNFAKSPLAAALLDLVGLPGMHGQHAVSPAQYPVPGQDADKRARADIQTGLSLEEEDLLASLRQMDPGMLRKSMKAVGLDFWNNGGLSNSMEQDQLMASLERLDDKLRALKLHSGKAHPRSTSTVVAGHMPSGKHPQSATPAAPSAPLKQGPERGRSAQQVPNRQASVSSAATPVANQSNLPKRQTPGKQSPKRSPSPAGTRPPPSRPHGCHPTGHAGHVPVPNSANTNYSPMRHLAMTPQTAGAPLHYYPGQRQAVHAGMPPAHYHPAMPMGNFNQHLVSRGWHAAPPAAPLPADWSNLNPPDPHRQAHAAAHRGASPNRQNHRESNVTSARSAMRVRDGGRASDNAARARGQLPASSQGVINYDKNMIGILFS